MTRPVRVLWLAKGLGLGGAERLLADCARHLDTEQFEVDVAYVLPWKDAMVPELRALGLTVHCLGGGNGADLRWVGRLRRLVRDREYQIVHSHMPVPAVAARLVLPRAQVRIVHTEHNVWPRYRRATRVANSLTYGRNDAVVAVSAAVAESVHPRYASRVNVVHHGVEAARFRAGPELRAAARRRLGLSPGAFVVGTVGNLTPKKDHRTLLEAFAEVHARAPESVLVLVGSGPLESELRRQVAAGGLRDAVHFAGTRDDVDRLLPGFDVFCLSSRAEGLPIALLEAMACAVPVVATVVGGVPEVVVDGADGKLVAPGRPADLAVAIEKLLVDPELRIRLGEAGRRTAARFDLASAQARIEAIYREVLGGRP